MLCSIVPHLVRSAEKKFFAFGTHHVFFGDNRVQGNKLHVAGCIEFGQKQNKKAGLCQSMND